MFFRIVRPIVGGLFLNWQKIGDTDLPLKEYAVKKIWKRHTMNLNSKDLHFFDRNQIFLKEYEIFYLSL